MDILFTGGAENPNSTKPLSLSRLGCKLIDSKDEIDQRATGKIVPRYSEKVLTGNWYEERTICPCLKDEWITVYNAHFKTYEKFKNFTEEMYTTWKIKQKTQGIERKLPIDGSVYNDNMTSSYDLTFRILPKGLCGPRKRNYNFRANAWRPDGDLTLSYGNQTKLPDTVKSKQSIDTSRFSPRQSIYKIDYNSLTHPKNPHEKRFAKPRANMNTPDLRHLGITLSSKTRPISWQRPYRSLPSEEN